MPLFKGSSKKVMSKNIKSEMDAGKPQNQSIAIAYNMAKRSKMSKGGSIGRDASKLDGHVHDEMCMAKGGMCYGGEASAMARGGIVEGEASKKMEHMNDNKHSLAGDDWDERDEAASIGSSPKEKYPASKDTGIRREDDEDEKDLLSFARPGNPGAQPAKKFDDSRAEAVGEATPDEDHDFTSDMIESIMKKRKMMAEGGMVDVSENADEEYNHADQLGFNALRKENYSESEGLDDLDYDSESKGDDSLPMDEHDMVEAVRKRLRSKRGA